MDYFKLAVDLTRQEASECKADLLAKAAIKTIAMRSYRNRGETCGCSAYQFPHRAGSGNCPSYTNDEQLLADFDRTEARWINGGAL